MPSFLNLTRRPKDDVRALKAYIRDKGKGWAALRGLLPKLEAQFKAYPNAYYQVALLRPGSALHRHATALNKLYDSKSRRFSYIKEVRRSDMLGACPYCGLPGNVSVDHYLPRLAAGFPHLSVCSANLVPACFACQQAKGSFFSSRSSISSVRNLRKRNQPDLLRILHPYFDRFLSKNVIRLVYTTDSRGNPVLNAVESAQSCKAAHRRLLAFHLRTLKVTARAALPLRRYHRAVVEEIRGANTLADAKTRLARMSRAAIARAGGAINSLEAVYIRSLLCDSAAVSSLMIQAVQPAKMLRRVSKAFNVYT